MNDLLPCPFCGKHMLSMWGEPGQLRPNTTRLCVTCLSCGARGPWREGASAQQLYVEVEVDWNKRADTPRKPAN